MSSSSLLSCVHHSRELVEHIARRRRERNRGLLFRHTLRALPSCRRLRRSWLPFGCLARRSHSHRFDTLLDRLLIGLASFAPAMSADRSGVRWSGSSWVFWCTALVGETSAHRFTDKLSLRFSRECEQRQDSSWTEPWLRRALPQELCRRLRLPVMSSAKHSAGQSSLVTPKWSHQLYVDFS